jgi:hypothetical protein
MIHSSRHIVVLFVVVMALALNSCGCRGRENAATLVPKKTSGLPRQSTDATREVPFHAECLCELSTFEGLVEPNEYFIVLTAAGADKALADANWLPSSLKAMRLRSARLEKMQRLEASEHSRNAEPSYLGRWWKVRVNTTPDSQLVVCKQLCRDEDIERVELGHGIGM